MANVITRKGSSVGKTEEFRRPSHNDFKDSSELRKEEFSGVRHNSVAQRMEIWILGEMKASMSEIEISINPKGWVKLYEETFGLPKGSVKVEGKGE